MLQAYIWIKAVHIIFVVAWMAGLLIFPRYKIHQLSAVPGGELATAMSEASQRLRRIILTPALIAVWGLGLTMIWLNPALLSQGWFHTKLALVLVLSGLHGYLISMGKKVDAGDAPLSQKTLRLLNEVPFLIMIGVVLLAVAKPF
ncbi:MAG: CopD family protein [Pseudomonadota bacterium]